MPRATSSLKRKSRGLHPGIFHFVDIVLHEPPEFAVSDDFRHLDEQKYWPEHGLYGPVVLLEQADGVGGHREHETGIQIKPDD